MQRRRRNPAVRNRYVPIDAKTLPIVARLMAGRDSDEYVLSRNGTVQLNTSNFRRDPNWKETGDGHTIHDFRHTAAVNWVRHRVPVTTIKAWLGHANIQTTMRYLEYLGMDIDLAAYEMLNTGQALVTGNEKKIRIREEDDTD